MATAFLAFVTSVFLTRLLGPERFGIYGLVFSFFALVQIFAQWGIFYATVTKLSEAYAAKNKTEIDDKIAFFLKSTLIIRCFVSVIFFIVSPLITSLLYQRSDVGHYARWLVLTLLMLIPFDFLVVILHAIRNVYSISKINVLKSVFINGLVIFFLLFGYAIDGVISAHVIAAAFLSMIALYNYYTVTKENVLLPRITELPSLIVKPLIIRKNISFGLKIALDKNLGLFHQILPEQMLGILSSPTEVGYFRLALSMVKVPALFFAGINTNVASKFPQIKGTFGIKSLKNYFWQVIRYVTFFSVVISGFFLIVIHFLFPFIYGADYIPSLKLIYIMILIPLMSGIIGPFGALYRTLDDIGKAIIAKALPFSILFFYLFKSKFDSYDATILYLGFYISFFLLTVLIIFRSLSGKLKNSKSL